MAQGRMRLLSLALMFLCAAHAIGDDTQKLGGLPDNVLEETGVLAEELGEINEILQNNSDTKSAGELKALIEKIHKLAEQLAQPLQIPPGTRKEVYVEYQKLLEKIQGVLPRMQATLKNVDDAAKAVIKPFQISEEKWTELWNEIKKVKELIPRLKATLENVDDTAKGVAKPFKVSEEKWTEFRTEIKEILPHLKTTLETVDDTAKGFTKPLKVTDEKWAEFQKEVKEVLPNLKASLKSVDDAATVVTKPLQVSEEKWSALRKEVKEVLPNLKASLQNVDEAAKVATKPFQVTEEKWAELRTEIGEFQAGVADFVTKIIGFASDKGASAAKYSWNWIDSHITGLRWLQRSLNMEIWRPVPNAKMLQQVLQDKVKSDEKTYGDRGVKIRVEATGEVYPHGNTRDAIKWLNQYERNQYTGKQEM